MKYNLSAIMKKAWEIKKENIKNIFAICLKMAWEEVKMSSENNVFVEKCKTNEQIMKRINKMKVEDKKESYKEITKEMIKKLIWDDVENYYMTKVKDNSKNLEMFEVESFISNTVTKVFAQL